MTFTRRIMLVAAFATTISLMASPTIAGTRSTRLEGKLRIGRTEIKAKHETTGARRKFSTEITAGAPSTLFTVVASRGNQTLGTWQIVTNALGFADLNRDTANGQQVPSLIPGDTVVVRAGTATAAITLRAR